MSRPVSVLFAIMASTDKSQELAPRDHRAPLLLRAPRTLLAEFEAADAPLLEAYLAAIGPAFPAPAAPTI
ncbi:MAG TPA: hypothetical protein VNC50_05270, partial [Planctomycetia bacterium]|nr:hypothetical protein [Planctomycetia bacterium]